MLYEIEIILNEEYGPHLFAINPEYSYNQNGYIELTGSSFTN
jgi:hypothetical protein